ncbi:Uu.00g056840.m01.CDS01 [Anthostomella pinea]|uniref:Uu.00g056840.m01.CDS01 n=1 Tax=Anthostomella pinea TaxID=933095 RepID=A0AAI8YM53_9PEZI|nr:Uu.00g056840.m01.CDS01 [Anthostomella pinea]
MPSSFVSRAGFASVIVAQAAHAYTQANIATPFMYKNIDPIVFPGSFDQSHLHSFFGSDAVTANTNSSAELQGGCSNADNPNDLSVYWVPTALYTTDSGSTWTPVPVMRFSAYYNLGESPAEVAIPQNVKMLAGAANATTAADMPPNAGIEWFCEGDDGIAADANGFPSSTCSTHLQTLLYFPECVNTDSLETAYKSTDYGTTNRCPEGMSSMPQLRFSIRYDLRSVLADGWSGTAPLRLSCGNAFCSHGDFINGWTPTGAQNMVATTSEKEHFLAVNGDRGNAGDLSTCTQTDADPTHGTSDFAESVALMSSSSSSKRSVPAVGWTSRNRLARSLARA